jgi:rhodanese-related sulfurtransferase
MGAIAAHELKKQGFSNFAYIDSGTQGWLSAGFTTNKSSAFKVDLLR